MTNQRKWKFLRDVDGKIKSNSGEHEWAVGQWYHESDVSLCNSGFHSSDEIRQAFGYVQGEYLARVEVKGHPVSSNDKHAHPSMKLVEVYRWTKADSVALAAYAAELVLSNYEAVYPNDLRPRKAIEAAQTYIADPSEENRSSAYSAADSARSAYSARSAAYLLNKIELWFKNRISSLEKVS